MRQIRYCCVLALAGAGLIAAQGAPDDGKLLATFQNPIGNLISVPFQNNVNFPIGQYSRVQDVLNIQPVIPISLNEDWLLITRWITPVVYQPNISVPTGGANGLGDLNPSFFLSPARPGKLIWGIGPTFLLPTATDPTLGQGKWGAGPSIVLLLQPKHWTIGFLSNNVWSIGGDRRRPLVNQFLTQYFINYNLDKGWFLTYPHVGLDGASSQPLGRPLRRWYRENHSGRQAARGLAGQPVLQPDSSTGHSNPQMASVATGCAALPKRKVT